MSCIKKRLQFTVYDDYGEYDSHNRKTNHIIYGTMRNGYII
jgi:hypothetical protein